MTDDKKKGKRGGKRAGAGRKPKAAAKLSLPDGLMPIDFFIGTMRGLSYIKGEWVDDSDIDFRTKMEGAKNAAPFLYPKLSNIDATLDVDGSLTIELVSYAKNNDTK
jgi:hypothetical protein